MSGWLVGKTDKGWLDGGMDGRMDGWMDRRRERWIDGMDGRMDGRTDEWMDGMGWMDGWIGWMDRRGEGGRDGWKEGRMNGWTVWLADSYSKIFFRKDQLLLHSYNKLAPTIPNLQALYLVQSNWIPKIPFFGTTVSKGKKHCTSYYCL